MKKLIITCFTIAVFVMQSGCANPDNADGDSNPAAARNKKQVLDDTGPGSEMSKLTNPQ